VAQLGDRGRHEHGNDTEKGKQREEATDLRLVQSEFIEKEDKDGAKKGVLGKDRVGYAPGNAPRQPAQLFDIGRRLAGPCFAGVHLPTTGGP
jgi:hypothetical protein